MCSHAETRFQHGKISNTYFSAPSCVSHFFLFRSCFTLVALVHGDSIQCVAVLEDLCVMMFRYNCRAVSIT